MRRRWRFAWDTDTAAAVGAVWFGVWMVVALVCALVAPKSTVCLFVLGVWLGPFAVAAVAAFFCFIGFGVRWLIENPPLQRIESGDE